MHSSLWLGVCLCVGFRCLSCAASLPLTPYCIRPALPVRHTGIPILQSLCCSIYIYHYTQVRTAHKPQGEHQHRDTRALYHSIIPYLKQQNRAIRKGSVGFGQGGTGRGRRNKRVFGKAPDKKYFLAKFNRLKP